MNKMLVMTCPATGEIVEQIEDVPITYYDLIQLAYEWFNGCGTVEFGYRYSDCKGIICLFSLTF